MCSLGAGQQLLLIVFVERGWSRLLPRGGRLLPAWSNVIVCWPGRQIGWSKHDEELDQPLLGSWGYQPLHPMHLHLPSRSTMTEGARKLLCCTTLFLVLNQILLCFIELPHCDIDHVLCADMLMKLLSCPTEHAKKHVAAKFNVMKLAYHSTLRLRRSAYLLCRSCFLGSRCASQFDLQLTRQRKLNQ